MKEKPWWVYACQILIVGCILALLVMMTAARWKVADSSSSTLELGVLGVGFVLMLLVIVRWSGMKDGPLWRAISFWFWW